MPQKEENKDRDFNIYKAVSFYPRSEVPIPLKNKNEEKKQSHFNPFLGTDCANDNEIEYFIQTVPEL